MHSGNSLSLPIAISSLFHSLPLFLSLSLSLLSLTLILRLIRFYPVESWNLHEITTLMQSMSIYFDDNIPYRTVEGKHISK